MQNGIFQKEANKINKNNNSILLCANSVKR